MKGNNQQSQGNMQKIAALYNKRDLDLQNSHTLNGRPNSAPTSTINRTPKLTSVDGQIVTIKRQNTSSPITLDLPTNNLTKRNIISPEDYKKTLLTLRPSTAITTTSTFPNINSNKTITVPINRPTTNRRSPTNADTTRSSKLRVTFNKTVDSRDKPLTDNNIIIPTTPGIPGPSILKKPKETAYSTTQDLRYTNNDSEIIINNLTTLLKSLLLSIIRCNR